MYRALQRVPVAGTQQQKSKAKTFPAPVRGLVLNENPATPQAGGAVVMRNWRPTQTGAQLRGGSLRHATIGTTAVQSLLAYDAGGVRRLYAANATAIYDVTAPASATVPPTPVVTGLTSGDFSCTNMSTPGKAFLIAVNGADKPRYYDGTAWFAIDGASTPYSITSGSPTPMVTTTLSDAWTYRNRLFYIQKGSLTAWYMPVTTVSGAALDISLAGVFRTGGSLLFGETWSIDSGDGIDDKCVFVSDSGEAAIYEGADPSDPDDWRLVGVYQIGRPLGKRATFRAGGDLVIATEEGLVPITAAIAKDQAALTLASISRNIAPEWTKMVANRVLPWDMVKWPAKKIAIVATPASAGQDKYCYVVNVETGAWGQYTGWDTRCLGLSGNQAYFGTSDGRVMRAEVGGSDDGMPYVCEAVGLFDHLGSVGPVKTMRMARATFVATAPFRPKVSASTDYRVMLPAAPASAVDGAPPDVWDTALWDTGLWDSSSTQFVQTRWNSIGRTGFTLAWQVQVTCGSTTTPDAEMISIDVVYEQGDLVV